MASCSCRGITVDCQCGCFCICAQDPNECWVGCEECVDPTHQAGDLLLVRVKVKRRPPGRPDRIDPNREVTIRADGMSLAALAVAIEKTANFRVGVPATRAGDRVTLQASGTMRNVLPNFGLTLVPKDQVAKNPPAVLDNA